MTARKVALAGETILVAIVLSIFGIVSACQYVGGPVLPASSAPLGPVISEPEVDNQLLSGADVHMETSPMQDVDAGSEHVCTDWEIWTAQPHERVWFAGCLAGVLKAHTHLGDGVFENSFAKRRDLAGNRDYELRVRHKDNSGNPATEWSPYTTRPFKTDKDRKPLPGAPQWLVAQDGYRVEEVASGFQLPVNIAMVPSHAIAPDKPLFYVTELYGTIKVVRGDLKVSVYAKNLLNWDPYAKFPGAGEIGLTGIVVEPQTGDVFASMLYQRGAEFFPKVVRIHSEDGGMTGKTVTTVLDLKDDAQVASHQISNLTIGPDGKLYVHMGDGFLPDKARDLNDTRGKVLRVNLDGTAPEDNPYFDPADKSQTKDLVFASGFRNPFGGAWRAADGQHYSVENGTVNNDRLARVVKGADYGWNSNTSSLRKRALFNWAPTHAPVGITFVQKEGNQAAGFPESKLGNAYVSESGPTFGTGPQVRGKRIVEFTFGKDGTVSKPKTLVEYNGYGKTTVAGIAAGPDGIYFSGLYPEQGYDPTVPGAKIYRVRYAPKPAGKPKPVAAKEQCTDGDLQVIARSSKTQVKRGAPVTFTLVIKNLAKHTCNRDIGADAQELFLMHGTEKVWSSDHCGAPKGKQVTALAAGREMVFTVPWNGKSSSSCDKSQVRVSTGPVPEAGSYQLFARVGTDRSAPVSIKLN
ncbi:PQQ-dependent sugar dehydrogenase [Catellatospora sp. NPDC049609]|uniref:PQQ-dependent sugar dehydrogenase n=1 Tax=Catellatospora sp. NPDC049609 TaxID=3155505 RepID=UPI00341AD33A